MTKIVMQAVGLALLCLAIPMGLLLLAASQLEPEKRAIPPAMIEPTPPVHVPQEVWCVVEDPGGMLFRFPMTQAECEEILERQRELKGQDNAFTF